MPELLLDLRNDAVFKLFFSNKQNRPILISFIETMIEPRSPIQSVKVLNPSLPKDLVNAKASILDLAIRLRDGSRIDLEMQVAATDGFRQRILYYWAKLHQSQLTQGDDYDKLAPTISIAVLDYQEFPESPHELHSIYELRERKHGGLYLPDLQLHFLELPKYNSWRKKSPHPQSLLDCWARLFRTSTLTETDLKDLDQEPVMKKAVKALRKLSRNPRARALAEDLEKNRVALRIMEAATKARARAEGKVEGKAETNRLHVRQAAKAGITPEKIAAMFEMPLDEVEGILAGKRAG